MIPEDFHTMAKDMYNDPQCVTSFTSNSSDEECFYRTLIDRAYYSAFLKSKEWVIDNASYQAYDTGKDHLHVRKALKKATQLGEDRHMLASRLYRLKEERGKASYRLGIPLNKNDAKKNLDESIFIITFLKTN